MKYDHAKKIMTRVIQILTLHCEQGFIHEAGSVRREKYEVKDIEVCCIPKKEFIQTDLFGEGNIRIIPDFIQALESITESVIKGTPQGRMMQIILKNCNGFKLDLFMPQKHDYFRIYAIRTGSKEYAQKKIAEQWLKLGWCGTVDGLRRITDCLEKRTPEGKRTWVIINKNGQKPPAWDSEPCFFEWLGIPYLQPHLREFKDISFRKELYK